MSNLETADKLGEIRSRSTLVRISARLPCSALLRRPCFAISSAVADAQNTATPSGDSGPDAIAAETARENSQRQRLTDLVAVLDASLQQLPADD
jgi:hypothetical protein